MTNLNTSYNFPYLRHLQKQKLRHNNAIVIRDSLRNDVAKAVWHEEEMKERREQQKMDIGKLNLLINQAEAAMQKLRKQYDTSVQHRNDRYVSRENGGGGRDGREYAAMWGIKLLNMVF